jgi:hypothetical protein
MLLLWVDVFVCQVCFCARAYCLLFWFALRSTTLQTPQPPNKSNQSNQTNNTLLKQQTNQQPAPQRRDVLLAARLAPLLNRRPRPPADNV